MQTSAFEILGPIMVGPSSSHTAEALRIALVARSLAPSPLEQVEFTLYNSFAHTYRGHGTDRALVAGLICRRSVDSSHAAELRASDLPWVHAGREAEAAGYPRLAT